MEALLDAADRLVQNNNNSCPPRPDFDLPADEVVETMNTTTLLLELKESPLRGGGQGWFATQNIPAGTVLLVDKPLAMVMDWQDDDDSDEEEEDSDEPNADSTSSRLNELLLVELLQLIVNDPSVWTDKLSNLFPRDTNNLPNMVSRDDELFLQVEALLQQIPTTTIGRSDIAKRLPWVIRYNALSIETCPELLIHPGPAGHASLTGTGVFYQASFFNHSSRPNVSRYSVGDIMWFVSNQDISAGQEACISYLAHDVLCESAARRAKMLDWDFEEEEEDMADENQSDDNEGEDGPELPVVDSDLQNELMQLDPFERLQAIQELSDQATGSKAPDEGDDMEEGEPSPWFQCDVHNLRIIRAITLDSLGQTHEALETWEACVKFTETMLPPNDEVSVVMRVQAALCAHHAGELDRAKGHAAKALATHNVLFGGGVARFRRRYQRELQLALRPGTEGSTAVDDLWPLQ